jgi:signal transduction histidine kinase
MDQRYSNLGYSVVRQFCHRIISQEVPLTSRGSVMLAIDKILDFCVLIETNAYMVGSSYCDKEVIKGISHQIRNPITVIGGNARRLAKRSGDDQALKDISADILDESKRLERLVTDIGVYMDIFQREAKFGIVPLGEMIRGVLNRLSSRLPDGTKVELQLDESVPDVQGDPRDLEAMFYYLLENSAEAVSSSAAEPHIRVSSKIESFASLYVRVEIFNSGPSPKPQDIGNLFSPFYSSKPTGTGFGLPIAELAARKNFAMVHLMPLDADGTHCYVDLPLPG